VENSIVVIPTYNEIENIKAIIEKVFSVSSQTHILIVDDNSPDGTAQVVEELKAECYNDRLHILKRKGKMGLGTAYIAGFKHALALNYDFIFEMDADFSHNPLDLPRLYLACVEGADVSIGSRYKNGVNVVNWPMSRVIMSYYASAYVRFITGMNLRDATAGFKCYKSSALKSIHLDKIKFVGYAFQIEMKYAAWKKGFVIEEVPVIFTDRTKGVSKMSPKIFKEAFFGVIDMRIRGLFRPLSDY
jgi:dolichol-phosphate mannosyltransferase